MLGDGSNDTSTWDPLGSVDQELERVREHLVTTLDDLAEKVLGQIQTTRGMLDVADSLLFGVRRLGPLSPPAGSQDPAEAHLRRLSVDLVEALRELPEWMQDGYVDTCRELARGLRALPAGAGDIDAASAPGE